MSNADADRLSGTALGPTETVSGRLVVVDDPDRLEAVEEGTIAYVPHSSASTNAVVLFYEMVRAGARAILCESLGRTDHGVLVANELGVPCLSDVDQSIVTLEGEVVCVDGSVVYTTDQSDADLGDGPSPARDLAFPETETDVTLAMGFPEVVDRKPTLASVTDGIGFMRLEFVLLDVLEGLHPQVYVDRHGRDRLERALADRLEPVVRAFDDRPVWIRTDDFAVEHLRDLSGGTRLEDPESNAMLGWRGIARSIEAPLLYDVQLGAIGRLLDRGYESIGLFPPMTRFPREYDAWKTRAIEAGCGDLTFGLMVETPAAALTFESFVDDIGFVVFGTNDLTQFTLAIDRSNDRLRPAYDETEPAVLALLERVIAIAQAAGVQTAIGGQAAADPRLIDHLLDFGIDQLAVAPDLDTIAETRATLARLERQNLAPAEPIGRSPSE